MTQEAAIKFKDEIKAFQEGKQIQVFTRKWVDDNNPSFSIKSKYRVKPVETKKIVFFSDGEKWYKPSEFPTSSEVVDVAFICENEKPIQKPTKRLPTIEEVEQWFIENKVFKENFPNTELKRQTLVRIQSLIPRGNVMLLIVGEWYPLEVFCNEFTHYDGSELYITENEKLTYGGEIADFPVEIVERMLECQVEQGFTKDVSVFERNKRNCSSSKGFNWKRTKEGFDFWIEVIWYKNFDIFFKKYPKK